MERTFKIINLTGLDNEESADIVQILNDVMDKRNMESGRKVVEFIIREYKRQSKQIEEEKKLHSEEIFEFRMENSNLKEELKSHIAITKALKELQLVLNKI